MRVSMVVPWFNEAERWNDDYWAAMFGIESVDWLFVDDGSGDATSERLESTISRHPTGNARLLSMPRNVGKAEAVRHGLLRVLAESDGAPLVGFMDADGAFAVEDLERLVSKQAAESHRYDATWSSRVALAGRNIQRSLWRHHLSRGVATIVCWNEPSIPYDTQSGLKIFTAGPALKACLAQPFRTRWMFEVELLARWPVESDRAMTVWEEPLLFWKEVAGSRISGSELFRIARELVVVKRVQSAARRAMRRRRSGDQ